MAIVRSPGGSAYFLPKSALRLPAATRDGLGLLGDFAAQLRDLDDQVERLVPDLRRGGASWSHIGTALGVTAETARLRYRDLEDS